MTNNRKIYVMVGPTGSGKTTIVHEHFKDAKVFNLNQYHLDMFGEYKKERGAELELIDSFTKIDSTAKLERESILDG